MLAAAETVADRPDLALGVQNVYWEPKGAFTGEISVPMARDAGARYALIGHSERRHIFGESDEDVRRKTAAALDGGLTPVVCLGETLEQREAGQVEAVILGQLDAASRVGSRPGVSHRHRLRARLGDRHGRTRPPRTRPRRVLPCAGGSPNASATPRPDSILYGRSVKPGNAAELLGAPDVDGLLVGGRPRPGRVRRDRSDGGRAGLTVGGGGASRSRSGSGRSRSGGGLPARTPALRSTSGVR